MEPGLVFFASLAFSFLLANDLADCPMLLAP